MQTHDLKGALGASTPPTLDHIGVGVWSLKDARKLFDLLPLPQKGTPELVERESVRVLMFDIGGGAKLELIEPTSDKSTVHKFLKKRGPGLHHISFCVDDIEQHMSRLRKEGVELINQEPFDGAGGTRVAFVHPRSAAGVLVELVQKPAKGPACN